MFVFFFVPVLLPLCLLCSILTEPPIPSILSSLSTGACMTVPSYDFGSKRSSRFLFSHFHLQVRK
uniref:Secreted protein n=1 Tax=Nelumbo nucifera TaxID=4432 RepID=A0A822XUJ8_NELNU|nr:TPA_asm: hypothetical protein HUJ06_024314 [Nelumbo nucifera]